jgi:hypothetical protein
MSYIRCTSNPEGLYVWPDKTHVNIWASTKRPLASHAPHSDASYKFRVPTKVFVGAMKKWLKDGWPEKMTYKKLTIRHDHIFTATGEIVGKGWFAANWLEDKRRREFLWRIQYGRHWVYLWQTTLYYLAKSAQKDGMM